MYLGKFIAGCAIALSVLIGGSVYAADINDLEKLSDKAIKEARKANRMEQILRNNRCVLTHCSKNEETGVEKNLFMIVEVYFLKGPDHPPLVRSYTLLEETIQKKEDGKLRIEQLSLRDGGLEGWPNGKLTVARLDYSDCVDDSQGDRQQINSGGGRIDLSNPKTKGDMQEKFDNAVAFFLNQ